MKGAPRAAHPKQQTRQRQADEEQAQGQQIQQQAAASSRLAALISARLLSSGATEPAIGNAGFIADWEAAGGRGCLHTLRGALRLLAAGDTARLALPAQALQDVSWGTAACVSCCIALYVVRAELLRAWLPTLNLLWGTAESVTFVGHGLGGRLRHDLVT